MTENVEQKDVDVADVIREAVENEKLSERKLTKAQLEFFKQAVIDTLVNEYQQIHPQFIKSIPDTHRAGMTIEAVIENIKSSDKIEGLAKIVGAEMLSFVEKAIDDEVNHFSVIKSVYKEMNKRESVVVAAAVQTTFGKKAVNEQFEEARAEIIAETLRGIVPVEE